MFMKKRFLSTAETADYLSTSRGVLANMRLKGQGPPYIKLQRKILYDLKDLDVWLLRQKVFTVEEHELAQLGKD